jgi:hypothetical protein
MPVVDLGVRHYGTERVVAASFLVGRLARLVAQQELCALLRGDAAGTVDADLAVHVVPEGWFDELAASPSRADATVAAHDRARQLGADLAGVFDPLLERLRIEVRLGRRGLWGLVADGIGGAGSALVPSFGPDAMRAAVTAIGVLPSAPMPTVDDEGGLLRASCCLAFRLPGHGYCVGCPVGRGRLAAGVRST